MRMEEVERVVLKIRPKRPVLEERALQPDNLSNHLSQLRPATCHDPVMPGFTSNDILLPRSAFTSWSSSSRLVRRSQGPRGVMRGLSGTLGRC